MKNTAVTETWFHNVAKNEPLVIAGPCSAETEEQVLKLAHAVKILRKFIEPGYGSLELDRDILTASVLQH